MSEYTYNRRQIMKMGMSSLAGISILGLTACGGEPGSTPQNNIQLQMFFWGNASRDKLTREAIKGFEAKNSNIKIISQFAAFDAYWDKLNTQVAGGSAPDLIQMDLKYLAQYVQNGQLLDMTSLVNDKTIDTTDFNKELLDGGKANNILYGIPLGGNYQVMYYDVGLVEQAKVGTLPESMSWDEFADYTTKLSKALGNGIYGTMNGSGTIAPFENWIRQHGKEMYTPDGKLGFELKEVTDWFVYWDNLTKAGGSIPMEAQVALGTTGGVESSPLIKGKAVFNFAHSNVFESFQQATKRPLGLIQTPTGAQPGVYHKASMLMSISAKSKYTKEAAEFINFIINEPEGVKALRLDRGTPGGTKAREILYPELTDVQKKMMDFFALIEKGGNTRPRTILEPAGAGKVTTALTRHAESFGFGKTSAQKSAEDFYAEALKSLNQ